MCININTCMWDVGVRVSCERSVRRVCLGTRLVTECAVSCREFGVCGFCAGFCAEHSGNNRRACFHVGLVQSLWKALDHWENR